MSISAQRAWPATNPIDTDGLRALIDTCRTDLDTIRLKGPDGDGADGVRQLERRLGLVAERLESATDALSRLPELLAANAAASPAGAAEVLAREADHRIKNSLQTVTALLQRQAVQAGSGEVRDALVSASARVAAIAQVHTALYSAPGAYGVITDLDLADYLGGLCAVFGQGLGVDGDRRRLVLDVEPVSVSPSTAQSIGLAVVELATNALRHAFEAERPGTVRVTGACEGQGWYKLCISDDGRGLPSGFDMRLRPSGLGLRLVNVLTDQLRAKLTVDGRAGARFTLLVPLPLAG